MRIAAAVQFAALKYRTYPNGCSTRRNTKSIIEPSAVTMTMAAMVNTRKRALVLGTVPARSPYAVHTARSAMQNHRELIGRLYMNIARIASDGLTYHQSDQSGEGVGFAEAMEDAATTATIADASNSDSLRTFRFLPPYANVVCHQRKKCTDRQD